jgi:hypothetical protein
MTDPRQLEYELIRRIRAAYIENQIHDRLAYTLRQGGVKPQRIVCRAIAAPTNRNIGKWSAEWDIDKAPGKGQYDPLNEPDNDRVLTYVLDDEDKAYVVYCRGYVVDKWFKPDIPGDVSNYV